MKKSKIKRFSVSIEEPLMEKFDSYVQKKKYPNRSEALRDLIRQSFVKEKWDKGQEIAGAITLIYDHHQRELLSKLTEIQHNYQKLVLSNLHIHIDHNNCLEIIAVKGKAKKIEELSDLLSSIKGVKHGTLSVSATDEDIN